MWDYRARITVRAPAERVAARVPPAVVVEAIDAESCIANVGSDTPRMLAFWIAMIDEEFDAQDHPELARELRALAARYNRAAGQPLPAGQLRGHHVAPAGAVGDAARHHHAPAAREHRADLRRAAAAAARDLAQRAPDQAAVAKRRSRRPRGVSR